MNEQELLAGLHAVRQERTTYPDVAEVHRHVLAIPIEQIPQRHGWLPSPRGWRDRSMFSALQFVAAGVIVALFGGFLLAGVLTTPEGDEMAPAAVTESPEPEVTGEATEAPTTLVRTDILPGVTLTVEEVEPGVLRVVNDGHRDLGHVRASFRKDAVITDGAGGVWRVAPESLYKIGERADWGFDPGLVTIDQSNTEATPDGHLVTVGAVGVRFFRDGSWDEGEYGFDGRLGDVGIGDDGTVWLLDSSEDNLWWYGPDHPWDWSSWKDEDTYDGSVHRDELVVAGGSVWLSAIREGSEDDSTDAFLRFDGTSWAVVPAPDGLLRNPVDGDGSNFGVTPTGVIWTAGDRASPHSSLARYDGSEWTEFGVADGVRPWGGDQGLWVGWRIPVDMLWVAPDGSAWVNAAAPHPDNDDRSVCDGLGRFDGESWTSYLHGTCIYDLDFAPDGTAWIVAQEWPYPALETDVHTYVITPEAVATSD